ncbi:MAG: TatD family hydrolase, partial [Candidatus Bipolaricaulia bacterium]
MRLIDSHAHLDDRAFDKDRAAVIARCFDASIGVITVGADLRSSRAAVRLAGRHRGIWATVGVHPHDAKTVTSDVFSELAKLAKHAIAIGEIGLDYYRDLSPRDVQRSVFAEQLALARRLDLPVAIHNRESTNDLLAILREAVGPHRGVIHSFLGDYALAETFIELGFHLGIGGPITFSKNETLREAVKAIPLDRILLETDCPYLTPVPYRGRRNEPAYVRFVAEAVAEIKGLPIEDVSRQTTGN